MAIILQVVCALICLAIVAYVGPTLYAINHCMKRYGWGLRDVQWMNVISIIGGQICLFALAFAMFLDAGK